VRRLDEQWKLLCRRMMVGGAVWAAESAIPLPYSYTGAQQ